jgi:putative hemolysin
MDPDPYSEPLPDFILLFSSGFGTESWIALAVIVTFLIISALMSGSEVAYFSISHNDLDNLQKEGSSSKNNILRLLDKPHYLLSTILITNNFVNIGVVLSSTIIFNNVLPEDTAPWLQFLINVVLVTFVLVLCGEILPKVYASNSVVSRMSLAKSMARPLLALRSLLYPVSWILVNSTKFIETRLASKVKNGNVNNVSQKEIEQVIEMTVKDAKFAKEEIGLLKSIVKFGNISVNNIMKSRIDVVSIDKDCDFDELRKIIKSSNYSRVPVFEETFDKIVGIIHSKDLIEHFDKKRDFNWHSLLRPAFFVPENKKIDDLFTEFQSRRTHMAIVVDEYGGTSGIVTLEDVLEEIVGEINDEFDEPEDLGYTRVNDDTFIVEGRTNIFELCKIFDLDYEYFDEIKETAETIAGLMIILNGSIPKKNSVINYKEISFNIVNSSERRIEKIKVTRL